MGVLLVGREDGRDDLGLVAEALREARAQRPVGQPADEDRLVGGLALAAEERAGDLARGVRALLDVDGEREEVDALAHGARGGRRREHDGVADARDDGAVGELGELAGLEGQGSVGPRDGTR